MAKANQRRRRNPEIERVWRERIEAWAASGMSARAFCGEHGIGPASFYSWRRRLREEDDRAAGMEADFVPVKIATASSISIEILHASGATVRLHASPSVDLLTAIFTALGHASC